MKLRLRTNIAWFLRGVAKHLNGWAEKLEPIKIHQPKEPHPFDWYRK